MKLPLILLAVLLPLAAAFAQTPASAPAFKDAARGATPIPAEASPPLLRNAINDDTRLKRNYSLQPPIIPHRVDGYQVTKDFNKCLDCHAREKTAFSQAVPVSETHYIDRDGKVLPRISTRRYFCQQCHVAQEPVAPLVGNGFKGDPADAPPAAPKH
jgi:cytochrome c-type protein NapB